MLSTRSQSSSVEIGAARKSAEAENPALEQASKHSYKEIRKPFEPADNAAAFFRTKCPNLASLLFEHGGSDELSNEFAQWKDAGKFLEGDNEPPEDEVAKEESEVEEENPTAQPATAVRKSCASGKQNHHALAEKSMLESWIARKKYWKEI